jgi:DMSO/TMAO reductase YedYZ molybdopterin-dependent catalytic subunit
MGGMAGRWQGAVAGIAAAAAAVGVAELVAVPVGARSAPLIAVGGVVVDHVPEAVKEAAIAVFGVHDKAALITGTAVLLAVAAAGIGVLAVRSSRLALAGVAVFTAIGVAAAVSRPGAGVLAALPTLVGAAVAVAVGGALLDPGRLDRLVDRLAPETEDAPPQDTTRPGAPVDRRRFLRLAGITVGAAAVLGAAGRWLSTRGAVESARSVLRLPRPADPVPPVPAGANLPVPGAAAYVTGNADFYRIDTALVVPQVDPASWRLRIHGRVRNPVTLTLDDLLARPMIERYVTLACVSNEVGGNLISNARWLGVRVKDLLDEAQPDDGADQTVARAVDGWTCGTPTAVLRDGRDALLAVAMNGEPLPLPHGFPVRMVVPGLYGYVSACKWIAELELTSFADFDAYWVPRGWAQQAPIKTESRIDVPADGRTVGVGPVTVAGVAWAQHRGVSRVEVQVDDGDWQPATLAATVSTDTWRLWSWRWTATPGRHTLTVRATDATGATQTSYRTPPAPSGATGWHQISVDVR